MEIVKLKVKGGSCFSDNVTICFPPLNINNLFANTSSKVIWK